MLILKIAAMTRKELADIAKADRYADQEVIAEFVARLTAAGLYTEATEDEIEELDNLI